MKVNGTVWITLVTAAVVVAGLAIVAPAYSYSSTVTTNATITSQYIYINVTDGTDPVPSLEFDSDWEEDVLTQTPESFEVSPGEDTEYVIKSMSNKACDAYVYGYFTGGGQGIKSITLDLVIDGVEKTWTVHRDAPQDHIPLSDKTESVNEWSAHIKKYTVNCYSELAVTNNTVPVSTGGDVLHIALNDLLSIEDISFYFFCSWSPLTGS